METRLEFQFAIFRVPKVLIFKARLSANISFENELDGTRKTKYFLYLRLGSEPFLKTEAWGNSEMAYKPKKPKTAAEIRCFKEDSN